MNFYPFDSENGSRDKLKSMRKLRCWCEAGQMAATPESDLCEALSQLSAKRARSNASIV